MDVTENTPKEIVTLETLHPTEGSILWLKQKKLFPEADKVEEETSKAIRRLQDYRNTKISLDEFIPLMKLAAIGTSRRLYDWIKFGLYYHSVNEFTDDDRDQEESSIDFEQAEVDLWRNIAVEKRESTKHLKAMEMNNQAETEIKEAQFYFNLYLRQNNLLLERKGFKPAPKIEPSKPGLSEFISKTFEEPIETTNLFFDPRIIEAHDDLQKILIELQEGKTQMPGIDPGILRTFTIVQPKGEFSFIKDEYDKLRSIIAEKHGVEPADIYKYTQWIVNAMFPSEKNLPENPKEKNIEG